MNASIDLQKEQLVNEKAHRSLMWVGIVSIVMLFAAFTSAYIVRKSTGNWMHFELPSTFYVSTALILISSCTLWLSFRATLKDKYSVVSLFLGLTLLLGLFFVVFQFMAYGDLRAMGVYAAGSQSNAAGSFLYLLTFLHLLHLLGGILMLIYTFIASFGHKYTSESHNGMYLCSTYWHFLTFLWIYLFLFLIYIR